MLRTDNKLMLKNVSVFCFKNRIIHQTSFSHTSQQNRVVKRKHKHILDVAKTIKIHMSVPKYLWSDVVLTACHLINRTSSSVLKKISIFCLFPNKTPFSMTLSVFECTCFIQDLSPELEKLSLRSIKRVFVGYSRT